MFILWLALRPTRFQRKYLEGMNPCPRDPASRGVLAFAWDATTTAASPTDASPPIDVSLTRPRTLGMFQVEHASVTFPRNPRDTRRVPGGTCLSHLPSQPPRDTRRRSRWNMSQSPSFATRGTLSMFQVEHSSGTRSCERRFTEGGSRPAPIGLRQTHPGQ